MLKSFKYQPKKPCLIMLGNSNVGKSTITRYLLKSSKQMVGKIGKKAGSTKKMQVYSSEHINYEILDFPGYGPMTTTTREQRNKIQSSIIQFIEKNNNLIFLSIIIINIIRFNDEIAKWYEDKSDTIPLSLEFMKWMNELGLDYIVVLNKIDKMNKSEISKIQQKLKDLILEFSLVSNDNDLAFLDNDKIEPQKISNTLKNRERKLYIFQTSAKQGTNLDNLERFILYKLKECSKEIMHYIEKKEQENLKREITSGKNEIATNKNKPSRHYQKNGTTKKQKATSNKKAKYVSKSHKKKRKNPRKDKRKKIMY